MNERADFDELVSIEVKYTTSLDDIKGLIDYAICLNKVCVLVFHEIVIGDLSANKWSVSDLTLLAAWINQRNLVEYACGPLTLHPAQYRAELDDEPLNLSASEFRLLSRLMERPGELVTVQQLCRATHDLDTDAIEAGSLIRPLIWHLRRKLPGEMIENVRGVGYRLNCE